MGGKVSSARAEWGKKITETLTSRFNVAARARGKILRCPGGAEECSKSRTLHFVLEYLKELKGNVKFSG